METSTSTLQDIFKIVRKTGVTVRQNVQACCGGCTQDPSIDKAEAENRPYIWTFGGQGDRIKWIDGLPYYADEITKIKRRNPYTSNFERARARKIYVNHGNGGAEALVRHLTAHDVDYEWQSKDYCVVVNF